MRDSSGCLGQALALAAMTVLVGVLIVAIAIGAASTEDNSAARSLPVLSADGLTWDHAGRQITERERTERERISQDAATQRAEDWQDFGRVAILAMVGIGGIWIVTRETGATVRNHSDNRAKVAMYQIYMREQYPNARIETRSGQQLVVDPDTRTVFPVAVLRAEARAAWYDEM